MSGRQKSPPQKKAQGSDARQGQGERNGALACLASLQERHERLCGQRHAAAKVVQALSHSEEARTRASRVFGLRSMLQPAALLAFWFVWSIGLGSGIGSVNLDVFCFLLGRLVSLLVGRGFVRLGISIAAGSLGSAPLRLNQAAVHAVGEGLGEAWEMEEQASPLLGAIFGVLGGCLKGDQKENHTVCRLTHFETNRTCHGGLMLLFPYLFPP